MIGDFMTKPLQGALFWKFRDQIMGVVPAQDPGPGKAKPSSGKAKPRSGKLHITKNKKKKSGSAKVDTKARNHRSVLGAVAKRTKDERHKTQLRTSYDHKG
jgi:hypothetical protein